MLLIPATHSQTRTHRLTLRVTDAPDVLPRVVTTCARRRADVVALSIAPIGDGSAAMELAVVCDARLLPRLERWLESLVDVREVRRR